MPRSALLPQTAPFPDDDRASLDRVLSIATPVQRAWLAGFLVGLESTDDAPIPLPAPPATAPLTILYASESGNAERLAQDTAKLARKSGFRPKVLDFADLSISELAKEKRLAVIAATWGEGEPPSRAAHAYRELMSAAAPRLDGVCFAVLALGDAAYAEFCETGKRLDVRLEELGATRVVPRVDCDLDFETPAAVWVKDALAQFAPTQASPSNVVAVDFKPRPTLEGDRVPVIGEILEHVDLNSSHSAKETIHLVLGFEHGAPSYEPGDSLDLFPRNDPALVDAVLAAAGWPDDEPLRTTLTGERDITTVSPASLEKFVALTGHGGARDLLDQGEARRWCQGRQLIDLMAEFPVTLSSDQLLSLTRPLPPRAYSIASSRKEVGDEAHLLIAAVRYQSHGRARAGVASTYAADRLRPGATVSVRLKPNRHFRLPDPSHDVIMVGPGTGVAPFRAFTQERRATGASGRSWLFFGDRNFTHDFLYQLEWQDALKDGALTRLDLAFSRDQPEKIYVQDRLWQRRRDVVDWLENGAHFYVCGDATAMAKDVRAALVRAYADVKSLSSDDAESTVAAIEREHRYLQDVY